jgi:NAD(P)-dependent dehydrogenase (short-subunit alcohol dehydrogenase family)
VADVLRASEAAVQRMVSKPALVDAAAVDVVEKVSFALLDYLTRLLARKPVSPVMLFPQYRAAQQLAGADRVHPADLSDAAQVDGLIGRIEVEGGPVDVLVNNAGIDLTGAFIDMPMTDSVLSYAPTKASFKRFALLLPDTDVHTLAVKTVRAVEKNKRSVRMPARAFLFPVLTNLPRRMAEMLLAGVPRREK